MMKKISRRKTISVIDDIEKLTLTLFLDPIAIVAVLTGYSVIYFIGS
tara:strand:- start:77722 stop:77862 length:141 start_codon:yes stop_codon:yes gene_type:complete